MENSKTSISKSNPPTTKEEEFGDEESSWTSYFEDFLCNNNEHNSSFSFGYESPSLVSDAASSCSVAKKFVDKSSKKSLSFKKRKTTKVGALVDIDHDHALEDTASSPVNSSKMCYLDKLGTNRNEKGITDISEEKGNNTLWQAGSQTADDDDELGST